MMANKMMSTLKDTILALPDALSSYGIPVEALPPRLVPSARKAASSPEGRGCEDAAKDPQRASGDSNGAETPRTLPLRNSEDEVESREASGGSTAGEDRGGRCGFGGKVLRVWAAVGVVALCGAAIAGAIGRRGRRGSARNGSKWRGVDRQASLPISEHWQAR